MSTSNSSVGSRFQKSENRSQPSQMSKISKKGITLGAQHASHGDDGVEKLVRKVGQRELRKPPIKGI
jgi:hypothetical protein